MMYAQKKIVQNGLNPYSNGMKIERYPIRNNAAEVAKS